MLKKRNPAATFEQQAATTPAAETAAAETPVETHAAVPGEQAPLVSNPAAAQAGHTQPNPAPTALVVPAAAPLVLKRSDGMVAITEAMKVIDSLKDAVPVNWDTTARLKAVQGNFSVDGKIQLGSWIEFELVSYQDNWVVSPGSDADEARKFAKYSDDGKVLKDDGRSVSEYLAEIKLTYPNAKLNQRLVLVASLTNCEKDATVDDGLLFQLDLAPTSMSKFNQYKNQAGFDMAKGRARPEDITMIRATCNVENQRGSNKQYTLVSFSRALTPA